MDLPIDHFRLLGVSPASDAQTVLRTLDQRLDRVPDQGFTTETLQARAKLLHDSADLLSDGPRRRAYEAELTAVAGGASAVPALDIPGSLEVAGLLLLLEAGQAQEAFELACRALQPPQAPALGSSREADLSLLAGLACLAAAEETRNRRHFEVASRLLHQGLQLLQRMGQLPELRQRLGQELDQLAPYLVLDLLSRELISQDKRAEGLELLEQLVQRRGGLEGDSDPGFRSEEFQAFFKQIRDFLTVQEQVDLFSRWADAGSEAADFLATIALTASGFAQRKPERIAAARERLLQSGRSGIEPLLANLHLLLGEVDRAQETFAEGASSDLRDWAARQSPDPLGQLCAYCRDWLENDVLPGYRDLEADPNLEAYFGDRDVIAWVEREDRRSGRVYAPPAPEPFTAFPSLAPLSTPVALDKDSPLSMGSFDWGSPSLSSVTPASESAPEEEEDEEEAPLRWRLPDLQGLSLSGLSFDGLRDRLRDWSPATWPLPARVAGAVGLGLVSFLAVALLRPRSPQPPASGVVTLPVQPPSNGTVPQAPAASRPVGAAAPGAGVPAAPSTATAPPPAPHRDRIVPLTAGDPTDRQLKGLLETWLAAKTAVLAGGATPADLALIARDGPLARLREERREDEAVGQIQVIAVSVDDLRVLEHSGGRIAVEATLTYSDKRRDSSGTVMETTPRQTLRNVYVFGRDGGRWRLAATRSGG